MPASYPDDTRFALGELEKVIGKVPDHIRNDYVGEQSRTHGDLTELLMSRAATLLPDQVSGLLLKKYRSPYVDILPMRVLGEFEGLVVKWMEIAFDNGLAPEVESEGVARLYTHKKTQRGARAVRRGVAARIQADFFLTEEGRLEWRRQIEHLATIIQRTNELDIVASLLATPVESEYSGPGFSTQFNHVYGARPGMSYTQRAILERDWFSIVNKAEDSRGFVNLCVGLRDEMGKSGVVPDAMILPPNLLGYYFRNNDDLWNASSAGDAAAGRNREIAQDTSPMSGIRTQGYMGMELIDSCVTRMAVGLDDDASSMLTVNRQIGEYYPMSIEDAIEGSSFDRYNSKTRNIRIFNEDHGRMNTVQFADAIKYCMRWNEDGSLSDAHDGVESDIFVHGDRDNKRACSFWGEVEEDWVSDDNVDDVITTVRAKLTKEEQVEIEGAVSRYQAYHDGNPALNAVYNEAGVLIRSTDEVYGNVRESQHNAAGAIIWKLINLMKKGCKVGAVNYDGVLGYIADKDAGGFYTWEFSRMSPLNTSRSWDDFLSRKSPVDRIIAYMYLVTPINRDNMIKAHSMDIYVPVDFVLARPYMTFSCSSVIILKKGKETGEFVIGRQRYAMTSNVADGMIYATMFGYYKAIVKARRNVMIAPSVFIQRYVKGNDTTFVNESDLDEIAEHAGLIESKRSILSILTKPGDRVIATNIIDIRGRSNNLDYAPDAKEFYATHSYYSKLYDITDSDLASPTSDTLEYESRNTRANSLCFLGHTESHNGQVIHLNSGHLGGVTRDQINNSRKPGHYSAIRAMPFNARM